MEGVQHNFGTYNINVHSSTNPDFFDYNIKNWTVSNIIMVCTAYFKERCTSNPCAMYTTTLDSGKYNWMVWYQIFRNYLISTQIRYLLHSFVLEGITGIQNVPWIPVDHLTSPDGGGRPPFFGDIRYLTIEEVSSYERSNNTRTW